MVTGKPLEYGGSHGRDKATGQGLVYVLEELLPEMKINIQKMTYSLIGFGNVGSWAARLLQPYGAKLLTVMDHTGAITNSNGIDAAALHEHVVEKGGVSGFSNSEPVSEEDFYSMEVDVFIPAALEQMITESKAKLIRCTVLAEAANAPVTPMGERCLIDQGVKILPAILCNAGGVTVSYFEWKQNRQSELWDPEVVDDQLKKLMVEAAHRVTDISRRLKCDLRTGAYCAALEHINTVYNLRGIFP